jgi:F-type H+-transporting ATPase subunit delta
MKVSKQAQREGKALFRSCLVKGMLDENRVRQAAKQVIASKPRGYIPVLSHFFRLLQLEVARRSARIESATPLAPELRASVQTSLGKVYGAGLSVAFAENPALIGGMRIKVGSDVYDGSVQARLAALQESF